MTNEDGRITLGRVFGVFVKVGAFTIGGGYAMIPVISSEMTKRGWMSENEVEDVVVLAQSAPGLLAVNMAVFTGRKLRGFAGSVVAAAGAVLPSFVIILLIAMFFAEFKENDFVRRIFQGVRPVAVALIVVPAVRLARSGVKSIAGALLMLASVVLVAFLKVSPIWIILCVIGCTVSIGLIKRKG